jgi:menaquinone-specific isochorismate synthase
MSTLLVQSPSAAAIDRRAKLAVERARQLGQPVLVTHSEPLAFQPDPLQFLALSSAVLANGVLWMQPQAGETIAGAGAAVEITAIGPGRFGTTRSAIQDIRQTIVGRDPDQWFPIIGGFAFEDEAPERGVWSEFPDSRLIVPRVLLQSAAGVSYLRVTECVDPLDTADDVAARMLALHEQSQDWLRGLTIECPSGVVQSQHSIPERDSWESAVSTAVSAIRGGRVDKVVLSREVRLLAESPFMPLDVLARLREVDASATVFALQSGRSWFVGATPERLVRLIDGRVEVTCLAGSIGIGATELEQRSLAAQLLASAKDIEEHEIVVRWTMDALEDLCEEVTRLTGTPRVAVARSVQHLETPLTARLSAERQVVDIVERLHPTPAMGGAPREIALTMIRELEDFDRGWYAAPFGWTDLDGSGEFAVAIRSALISGRKASVFAGSGIVADSIPADEFQETELKLRPMLSALGAS